MYSINLMIAETGLIAIKNGQVEITVNRPLTLDEMAVVGSIAQTLACLQNGKLVKYDFDPKLFEKGDETIACEWLPRSGTLKVHGATLRQRHYVTTVEAAILEKRRFTCPRALLTTLPFNRDGKPVVRLKKPKRQRKDTPANE